MDSEFSNFSIVDSLACDIQRLWLHIYFPARDSCFRKSSIHCHGFVDFCLRNTHRKELAKGKIFSPYTSVSTAEGLSPDLALEIFLS